MQPKSLIIRNRESDAIGFAFLLWLVLLGVPIWHPGQGDSVADSLLSTVRQAQPWERSAFAIPANASRRVLLAAYARGVHRSWRETQHIAS